MRMMSSTKSRQLCWIVLLTAFSLQVTTVSSSEQTSEPSSTSSLSNNNIFQSPTQRLDSGSTSSPSPSSTLLSQTETATTSPPTADNKKAHDSWNLSLDPDLDQQSEETSSNDDGALDFLPFALKFFVLGFAVTSTTFWLYVICRNRILYRKRIEETRQAMVMQRRRRRTSRTERAYSNRQSRREHRIVLTHLSDTFRLHDAREGRRSRSIETMPDNADIEQGERETEREYRHNHDTPTTTTSIRSEQIVKRFHFHTVLSDNATSESIMSSIYASQTKDEDDEDTKVDIEDDSSTSTPNTATGESSRTQEEVDETIRNAGDWFHSWHKALSSPRLPTCCICLENYSKGETICVPITKRCKHFNHEECMVAWLQKHNDCPLCRVDLMEEEEDENHE